MKPFFYPALSCEVGEVWVPPTRPKTKRRAHFRSMKQGSTPPGDGIVTGTHTPPRQLPLPSPLSPELGVHHAVIPGNTLARLDLEAHAPRKRVQIPRQPSPYPSTRTARKRRNRPIPTFRPPSPHLKRQFRTRATEKCRARSHLSPSPITPCESSLGAQAHTPRSRTSPVWESWPAGFVIVPASVTS